MEDKNMTSNSSNTSGGVKPEPSTSKFTIQNDSIEKFTKVSEPFFILKKFTNFVKLTWLDSL